MTVSEIASAALSVSRTLNTNNTAKLAASINSLLAPSPESGGRNDTTQLANAALLQSQMTGLRSASQQIVQAQSVLTTADQGAEAIDEALVKMQQLAKRASAESMSVPERATVNAQFDELRQTINKTASTTRFNGKPLLDGSLSSQALGEEGDIVVGGFSGDQLFGNTKLELDTSQDAAVAAKAVEAARAYVAQQRAAISELKGGLDYAAAVVDTATQNVEASRSELGEGDFFAETLPLGVRIEQRALEAMFAQTNKLPSNVLQLLNE